MSRLPSLYTDEDISALVAVLLRARGLDVATAPEQGNLGKTDREQLEFAVSTGRCFVTHNRVDFERLNLQFIKEDKKHRGIIIVPQKSAYEVAQRVSVLVNSLTVDYIDNHLLYS